MAFGTSEQGTPASVGGRGEAGAIGDEGGGGEAAYPRGGEGVRKLAEGGMGAVWGEDGGDRMAGKQVLKQDDVL